MNLLVAGDIDSVEGNTVCSILCMTFWDLARLGGFGIFVGGLISVAIELFCRDRNKAYSFVLLGGSIFGFIGSIMLSLQSIVKSVTETAQRYDYSYDYGSSYSQGEAMISSLTSNVTTACVFIIVSAVVAFVAAGIAASAGKNANMYGYIQMPNAAGMNAGTDGAWYCPNCGAPNSGSSVICRNCGNYK